MSEAPKYAQRHYGTFGGVNLRNYVEVDTQDPTEAREAMFMVFGTSWAFVYSYSNFNGQPEEYDLQYKGCVRKDGLGKWVLMNNYPGVYEHVAFKGKPDQ
jgi:hypothetical protein